MLNNRNIIYFANDWNTDHKVSSHHIAKELLKNNRLIYVETGGMRKPRTSARDLKRIFSRLASWLKGIRKIDDNLYIYSLIIFPFHQRWARSLNIYLNVFILRAAIKRYKFKEPILWFVTPHVSYFAHYLPKKFTLYYSTDNVSLAPGVDKEAVECLEDDLLRKADAVFGTSEYLCDRLRRKNINPNVFYSPQAVNVAHFFKVQEDNTPLAEEIKNLKKPVIGYIGLIEEWIDLDLIGYVAQSRPEWSIILIGRVAVSVENLKRFSNIKFLGIKKYEDLPSYLKGFDVCISPFKINEFTKGVNPIKVKEYLASGKPVVSTHLPEMEKFRRLIEIADTYQDFIQKIEYSYKNATPGKVKERIESIRIDNWYNRVGKVSEVIENIERKSNGN